MEVICVGCSQKSTLEELHITPDGVECGKCNGLMATVRDPLFLIKGVSNLRIKMLEHHVKKTTPDPQELLRAVVAILSAVEPLLIAATAPAPEGENRISRPGLLRPRPPRGSRMGR